MPFSLEPDRPSRPKRRGAIFGLFDSPPYRDWLVWWTGFWLVMTVISIGFPAPGTVRTSELPRWLDTLLAAIFFTLVFGLLPAYLRVRLRRRASARQRGESLAPRPAGQAAGGPPRPLARDVDQRDAPTRGPAQQQSPSSPSLPRPTEPDVIPHLQGDPVLASASEALPYPIARAVRRLQQAGSPKDVYESTLRAGELLSVVVGISAVSWAVAADRRTDSVDLLLASFGKGVSQGLWLQAAGSVERAVSEDGNFPGLATTLRKTRGTTALVDDLKLITEERNAWAHGASPRSNSEAGDRTATILPALRRALERAAPLSQHDWLMVESVRLMRGTGRFELAAARAMGAHPDWHRTNIDSGGAVPNDSFYLRTTTGLIDLMPFVVMRQCPKCNQPELAYADRVDRKKGVSLKSFDSGHPFFDPLLTADLQTLINPPASRHASSD